MFSYFASRDSHLHSISPSYLKFAVRGSRFAARTLPQSLCLIHKKFAVRGSRLAPSPCLNISLKSSRFAPRPFLNLHFHSHKKIRGSRLAPSCCLYSQHIEFAPRASHLTNLTTVNRKSSRFAPRSFKSRHTTLYHTYCS